MSHTWDLTTQEFHGGQAWRNCPNYRADFSVTTNAFGAPKPAVAAAAAALDGIHHYPAADAGEATRALAAFCDWPASKMLVGNGASEFIDLVMRVLPVGPFAPGPFIATYSEYRRAALAVERQVIPAEDVAKAAVSVVIRPNSPTGECLSLSDVDAMVHQNPTTVFVFDESFLPFAGSRWRDLSALALIEKYGERVIVINSWTKLWSCPGIRIGTVAACDRWIETMKKKQTPWSCNSMAQAFAVAAVEDKAYLEDTWKCLREWRVKTEQRIKDVGLSIDKNCESPAWVPWTFVRCPSEKVARLATKVAESVGCPIRHCESHGLPQHIRIAVRQPEHQKVLFEALGKELTHNERPEAPASGNVEDAVVTQ